jgi:hypothetical protein
MSPPVELMTQSREELEGRFEIRMQGWLTLHPRLRVRLRLEDATSPPDRPIDDAPVYQEQEDDCSLGKRRCRPVRRVGQVVLQVQTGVADGLFKERGAVLIIVVQPVMSELTYPEARQLTDE